VSEVKPRRLPASQDASPSQPQGCRFISPYNFVCTLETRNTHNQGLPLMNKDDELV